MQFSFNYAKHVMDQKTIATNADLLLIRRNPEDQKATATNADLLLIMRNLKTKKQQ